MQRFCLAVTLSGLLLLFTAVTLVLIKPELLRAQTVADLSSDHRPGR
jgi:hypothetical protein